MSDVSHNLNEHSTPRQHSAFMSSNDNGSKRKLDAARAKEGGGLDDIKVCITLLSYFLADILVQGRRAGQSPQAPQWNNRSIFFDPIEDP